jgi:ankyrin repeat protein
MRITPDQLAWLQVTYNYLNDLGEDDPSPIDPVTWKSPEGDRLIHIAALRGDLAAVDMLLTAGEDVNAVGDMGQTPAHFAAMNQHKRVYDLLMASGTNATIIDEFGRTPPQTWALFEKLDGSS